MTEQSQLIAALTQPEAYPRRPDHVDVLQTHISILFFAGDEVFKVKKAVDLGFVDYSTLDRRRHFCNEEVRLNRRLAKDIYHGVARIVRDDDGTIRVIGGEDDDDRGGEVIDYAVHMRRLPADRMLAALLDRGEIDNAALGDLAALLVTFHNQCETGEGVDEHATPDAIAEQVHDNLKALDRIAGSPDAVERGGDTGNSGNATPIVLTTHRLSRIRKWMDMFLDRHRSTFEQRVRDGRVRDGHGDLHAGNICLLDDAIVIYDCIEFTRRFRCRDVACELAFLAMDLDRRGFRGFSRFVTRAYAERSRDAGLDQLVPFYKLHLACVRAMVAGLRATEDERPDRDREDAVTEARQYAQLAGTYVAGPSLAITCGLPGSGKSTAAQAAAIPFEAIILRSDVIRKRLAGFEPTQRVPDDQIDAVYGEPMTQRTYDTLRREAEKALRSGRSVIADATFATRAMREPFAELAASLGMPFAVIWTEASDAAIAARMQRRARDATEVSDAGWDVYEQARARFEPPEDLAPSGVVRITGDVAAVDIADRVINALIADTN